MMMTKREHGRIFPSDVCFLPLALFSNGRRFLESVAGTLDSSEFLENPATCRCLGRRVERKPFGGYCLPLGAGFAIDYSEGFLSVAANSN
jgi:hypothetical protein